MERIGEAALAWAEANAAWAPLIAFAVAFVESVPLIGIFLPGSALLLGLGLLIGTGVLPAWPMLLATFAGAVIGDALGFWLSRWLGPAFVRAHLPRGYRRSYARGVLIFRRWGIWAVFIARFISPLRAVAPVIAGVSRMSNWRFQAANIGSAVVWAPLLLVPGTAVGAVAALVEDRGDALLLAGFVLGVLLVWWRLRVFWARASLPQ
ncbi:DedA family protein [Falsiroseomonas tokyonensis]|uniref:DedA family protein n=1 Tax=Falsiroseomonas tokyonensis TaxID=430521 RepID=A0ABV7BLD4_9PROT|nr:DedA family protein [Falsiroseomonas tokyonensis]MBU8536346.1 DedA family protein [Falsiroseomonas tokyonensis]